MDSLVSFNGGTILKALLFVTALTLSPGARALSGLRYVKTDRPAITLVFREANATAVVTDEASGTVLVEGHTFIYDDPSTLRIDPDADSVCPPVEVTFGARAGDQAGRWASVSVRPVPGGSDPACRASEFTGDYAPAR